MYKISAQSVVVVKSYRANGRPGILTDSRVYSLFEYTNKNVSLVHHKLAYFLGSENISNQRHIYEANFSRP